MNGFYKFAMSVMRLIMPLCYRIEAEGMENLPKKSGYLFVSNHRSNADPILIGIQNPKTQFCFLAKQELFSAGLVGWLLRKLGAIAVDRGAGDVSPLEEIEFRLQNGENALIFPEGTRSKDGKLGHFKTGAALIAAQTGVPVIPVAISFDDELHFRCTIYVRYGKPFQIPQTDASNPSAAVLKEVRKEMTRNVSALLELNEAAAAERRAADDADDEEEPAPEKTGASSKKNHKESEVREKKMSKNMQNDQEHKKQGKPESEKSVLKKAAEAVEDAAEDIVEGGEELIDDLADGIEDAAEKVSEKLSDDDTKDADTEDAAEEAAADSDDEPEAEPVDEDDFVVEDEDEPDSDEDDEEYDDEEEYDDDDEEVYDEDEDDDEEYDDDDFDDDEDDEDEGGSSFKLFDSFKKLLKKDSVEDEEFDDEDEDEDDADEDDSDDDDDDAVEEKKPAKSLFGGKKLLKSSDDDDEDEDDDLDEDDEDDEDEDDEDDGAKGGLFGSFSLKNAFRKKETAEEAKSDADDDFDDFDDEDDEDYDEESAETVYAEDDEDEEDEDDEEEGGKRIDYGRIALILTFVILGIFAVDFCRRLWNDWKSTQGMLDLQNQASSMVESMGGDGVNDTPAMTTAPEDTANASTLAATTLAEAVATTTTTEAVVDNRETKTIAVSNKLMHSGSVALFDGSHQQVDAPDLVPFSSFPYQHLRLVSTAMQVDSSLAAPIINWFNDFFAATGLGNVMVYATTDAPAFPPYSAVIPERTSGLTLDLAILNEAAKSHSPYTPDGNYAWLTEHAADYGFIVRYPANKADKTGQEGMTWHFRYVGAPHAKYMYENDLCLEEYLLLLQDHTWNSEHLTTTVDGVEYEIYYVPASETEDTTDVKYPITDTDAQPLISGDNNSGFVVAIPKE